MRRLISLAYLCLLHTLAFTQVKNLSPVAKPEEAGLSAERLTRIDKTIDEFIAAKRIPGAVVLIARKGKIAYHKAYGVSDIDTKTPLRKDDIFRIASQTKAITSLAVMMLWEEGKFSLNDPVSKYIPEYKSPQVLTSFNMADSSYTAQPAKSEITIRQLLTHTSGIDYASIGSPEFKAIYAKAGIPSGIGNHTGKLSDKMKALGKLPLKHNPGERYTYGLNDDVLGYLVEVLSGLSFDEFLRTRIFLPLGMKDTYFYLPKEKAGRLVALHENRSGAATKINHTIYDNVDPQYPTLPGTYFSGGAGLSSTAEDYARFLQLFLNGGKYNGVQLLSRKTVELMLTNQIQEPITEQFGLGFGLETPKNDHVSVLSVGSFLWGGAFATNYWADPKEKLIGVIFTNIYYNQFSLDDKFKVLTYQSITD